MSRKKKQNKLIRDSYPTTTMEELMKNDAELRWRWINDEWKDYRLGYRKWVKRKDEEKNEEE